MRFLRGVITVVLIVLIVVISLYETSLGMHVSDYTLYLRTHPPALALFITLYIMLGVFFYIIARWWS